MLATAFRLLNNMFNPTSTHMQAERAGYCCHGKTATAAAAWQQQGFSQALRERR
jgi:hypothetical protein